MVDTALARLATVATVVAALGLHAHAQASRATTRDTAHPVTISGRVVADDDGTAIEKARVAVTPATPGAPVTLTDADGRFSFSTPTTRVTLTVSHAGYATTGAAATAGTSADIRLRRGAAIEGRVVDNFGEPSVDTPVRIRSTSTPPVTRGVTTDDRGDYRIGGLPAGTFDMTVLRPAADGNLGPTEATTVSLGAGEVVSDVDFQVGADRLGERVMMTRPYDAAQQPGSATIRGAVLTTDGRPVSHANVTLIRTSPVGSGSVGNSRGAITVGPGIGLVEDTFTDLSGSFAFSSVPAGTYDVEAIKHFGFGLGSIPSRRVRVDEGGTADVQVEMPLNDGAIEGYVTDDDGAPLQDVAVQALEIRYERGARRLVPSWSGRVTDDLGHYRLFGLPPGQYVISASPDSSGGELPGYARSFYPGTTVATQAEFVSVGSGETAAGINVFLSRDQTFRIRGQLLDSTGEPTTGGNVSLVPSVRSGATVMVPVGARIAQNGAFEFSGVLPGQYVVVSDRGRKGRAIEGEFGSLAVTVVDRDVTGLVLQASAGSTIAGRIVLDSATGATLPSVGGIDIVPLPVDFDAAPKQQAVADVRDDGVFIMQGITGSRRIEVTGTPRGWMLEQVRAGGIDITDRPLPFGRPAQSRRDIEVVLTDRVCGLTGTVMDDRGAIAQDAQVLVFPVDRDRRYAGSRYLAAATTSEDGTFSIAGLPAGSYYVAAIPRSRDNDPDGWRDPQMLESFTRLAQSILVREGEITNLNLRQLAP